MSKGPRSKSKLPIGKEKEEEDETGRIGSGQNIYQLGAEIGRGGFGVVFQAFNVRTGDFVAVKRFPLHSIDKESLSSIEGEIELMQKLNHPNIVKYIDTIRTKSYLYIVLEYMENGSLSNVIKKFGFFSESLTAIYVTQVLRGLRYLHEQGVLHRDIKGANILTTKDGMVKLADFGVAIKLTEAHCDEQDVVGSPYWIAPEIIEMSAPTSACDIWSVGCIIIELLTGKPPYFDLEPMAALFRIVSDDYPPLPEGISQALRDFLLNCFQKEPVMRSSAAKLLDHPWLMNSSTHSKLEEQTKKLGISKSSSSIDLNASGAATDSIMNTIRLHQREVTSPSLDLSVGSIDGIAMRNRANLTDLKTYSSDQKDDSSGRQTRHSQRHSASRKTPQTSSSPRHQSTFFRSASSGGGGGGGGSPAVMLTHMETNSVISDSPEGHSGTSSVAADIPMEALSRRGLVRHELANETPPVEHMRSMSPISDSTAATKDNTRIDAFPVPALVTHEVESDFGAGFSDDDDDDSPLIRHNSSFFSNVKMAGDSDDENWDTAIVQKGLSASIDSGGDSHDRSHQAISPARIGSTKTSSSIARQGSHSSSASEHNAEQMSLRNRSVDLVAKLKSASLNAPSSGSFVLASDSKAKGLISPIAQAQHVLAKYQEDDEDENFDELFEASQHLGMDSAVKKRAPATTAMKTIRRVDTFESTCMQSADTAEWQNNASLRRSNSLDKSTHSLTKGLSGANGGGKLLRKIGTKESLDTVSSSDDFDDLGFDEDDDEIDKFADKLRSKLKAMGKEKETPIEDEPDEFINYQFDEKDFKQNELKDIHFRRSREVVDLLGRIRVTASEEEIAIATEHIINIFDEFPEQREHLITYHGVMPIIDMFESQASISDHFASMSAAITPNMATYSLRVLVIVNKIIEGSIRAQEQLALMGIIPTIMNVLEKTCRTQTPNRATMSIAPFFAPVSHYSSSMSIGARTPLASVRIDRSQSFDPRLQSTSGEDENASTGFCNLVDPVTMEAARFIHTIALSSSLTLQMLIGAGGLMVLTTMASFGTYIGSAILPKSTDASADTVTNQPAAAPSDDLSADQPIESDDISVKIRAAEGKPQALAAMKASLPSDIQALKLSIPGPTLLGSEDALGCMRIFQMGMDCIAQLFSVQSSRTRDFCRLFVKLGLLGHLSVAFGNLRRMYYDLMRCSTPEHKNEDGTLATSVRSAAGVHRRSDSITSIFSATDSFCLADGATAPAIHYNAAADDSTERIYAHMIATLFFKFSRSDSVVAETMANPERGVIRVLLETLAMPELRHLPMSPIASTGTTPVGAAIAAAGANAAANSTSHHIATTSLKLEGSLSSSNWSIQGSQPSVAVSTPFTSSRKNPRVSTLSPAYLEMLELLLKCLKNLSMEPSALADLERAGTIECIIPLLSGPLRDRYIVHILPCLFNLLRINKRRQELAATLGIVPHLKKVISEGSHLRQFALPIIFDLAHTSNATRMELWKHDCVSFYLNLLKESYWQAFALNSLAVWMSSDPKNVAKLLVQPACLAKLIDFFEKASTQTLHSLHKPLLDIMSKSSELSSALAYSGVFISALVRRLNSPQEAIVLRTLLKMLQLLHQYHASPRQLVLDHGLYDIVKEFAQSESQVLVCQIANRLLMDFQLSTFS